MMKIGVSAYSFNRYFRDSKMPLAEMVKAAAKLGFEGFEMLPRYFKTGKGSAAQARELRKMLADAGLTLSCYTLGNDFGLPDGPGRQAVIDEVRAEIDVALLLGVRTCRVESTFGPKEGDKPTYAEMHARVVRGTKEVADYALKYNIRLGVENHGRYMAGLQQVLQLIKDVNSPAYGANPDIGNFLSVDDDPLEACRELAQYTVHVHAKDFRRRSGVTPKPDGWYLTTGGWLLQGAVVGEGDVPVKACLQALRTGGYDGFLSVEHESPEDPIDGLKRSLANLKKMVGELE